MVGLPGLHLTKGCKGKCCKLCVQSFFWDFKIEAGLGIWGKVWVGLVLLSHETLLTTSVTSMCYLYHVRLCIYESRNPLFDLGEGIEYK